jgi:UDP-N-acetylglucosamine 2-epimerase (non-hydrolysing)
MRKVLFIFGTRPEAIKMAPVVRYFKNFSDKLETRVCVTAQHREMLDQVLDFFEINPDYDLNLMKKGQNLFELSARILQALYPVLNEYKPDLILVHGDTTTTMMGSIAAFYNGSKIGHIEAGLRTHNKWAPFPEEINRQITGRLTDFHFAPTQKAKENLLTENVDENQIIITGNTVIDALYEGMKKLENYNDEEIKSLQSIVQPDKKLILITGHRRENFGEGFINICNAIKEIAENNQNVQIIYPVHLNPNVQKPVFDILGNLKNVHLINPLRYPAFLWLMNQSFMIITDSGGIQEEAPSLGKPVLVMRNTTERPEAVDAGTVLLVGTDKNKIVNKTNELLKEGDLYKKMKKSHNPYGDGKASKRIFDFINNQL